MTSNPDTTHHTDSDADLATKLRELAYLLERGESPSFALLVRRPDGSGTAHTSWVSREEIHSLRLGARCLDANLRDALEPPPMDEVDR
jgi:hypothetical protein